MIDRTRAPGLRLATLATAALLGLCACGSKEGTGDGTGGASSENASVDATDSTQGAAGGSTVPVAGEQPQTAGETGGAAAGSPSGGAVSDPASAGVAVDTTGTPRGIEGSPGVQPGTGGVDASAGRSPPAQ